MRLQHNYLGDCGKCIELEHWKNGCGALTCHIRYLKFQEEKSNEEERMPEKEMDRYKLTIEDYDEINDERNVSINNGLDANDGYYMTIRQMTKDDMTALFACLHMGQGEGCRSESPLINAIIKVLAEARKWEEV